MGFILQFFDGPAASTVASAVKFVERTHPPTEGGNEKFRRFVASISKIYPPSAAGSHRQGLWPEGLDAQDADGPVVNVALNTDLLDLGTMTVLARHAADAGLQILDPQNAILYRLDFSLIRLGRRKPEPLPPAATPLSRPSMTEQTGMLSLGATVQGLGEGWLQLLAPHGFTMTTAGDAEPVVLWRVHGGIRQMLRLENMRSTEPGRICFFVRLGFACDEIPRTWLPLLPPRYAQRKADYDRDAGGVAPDVEFYLASMERGEDPLLDLRIGSTPGLYVASAEAMQALWPALATWSQSKLVPLLDSIGTISDLCEFVLTARTLDEVQSVRPRFPLVPGLLTLARRRDVATLEAYANAYRRNRTHLQHWGLFGAPKGEHFEALVDGLRKIADAS